MMGRILVKLISWVVYALVLIFLIWLIVLPFLPAGRVSLRSHLGRSLLERWQDFIRRPPKVSWLSTQGNKIVNEEGRPQVLRGVNLSSLYWGYEGWHPQAIKVAVRDWGAQIIRTRIYQEEFFKDKEAFFKKLEEEIIKPAKRNGIYVVFNPQIGEEEVLPDEGTYEMWQEVAKRYRDEPVVLYDLLTEPYDVEPQVVRGAYTRLIETVREAHSRSLIFVSGLGWGRAINNYLTDPFPYENIVYRTNPYSKPGEFKSLFGDLVTKYPVFIGEFGPGGFPPMTLEAVESLIGYAEQLGLGWTAWNFHAEGCPCLLSDWQTFAPSEYGQLVKEALSRHPDDPDRGVREPVIKVAEPGEIYRDSLENNFVDVSWDSEVDLLNSDLVSEGDFALKVSYNKQNAGLFLHCHYPLDSTQFDRLEFQLHWGEVDPFDLQVILNDQRLHELGRFKLQAESAPQTTSWFTVVIPLEVFDESGSQVDGLMIMNLSESPQGPIYLDNIRFR
jgi:hypothetical protein